MKRLTFVVVLLALLFSISLVSFAQDIEPMMGKERSEPMKDMRLMHKMMKYKMGKSLVATKDGGVVVLIGKKLLKYDKNLNLKKEVEIKLDTQERKQMKGGCSGGCKGCKKMTGKDRMRGNTSD